MANLKTGSLHMLRLRLETGRLVDLGRKRHLPAAECDLGYLIHCQLGELFGPNSPKPFAVINDGTRHTTVLAYSDSPAQSLRERTEADMSAALCLTEEEIFDSKPMPESFEMGQILSFKVRICPVVRMSAEGTKHRKGAEVDAFLRECRRIGERSVPVDREAVYRDWLSEQIRRCGGCTPITTRMISFNLERFTRRTHSVERKAKLSLRPDVEFEGLLEVTDPGAFLELLRRGIGRHRAFGFGMLLLRRPPD